jgi:hypothetical protein
MLCSSDRCHPLLGYEHKTIVSQQPCYLAYDIQSQTKSSLCMRDSRMYEEEYRLIMIIIPIKN